MPPRKKFKCSVALFDTNISLPFKEQYLECYNKICAERCFGASLDLSQLILMNTEETKNHLNDKYPDQYKNIVEATELVYYNPENKSTIIRDAQPAPGNWLEGLYVATDVILSNFNEKKFNAYQILVFSDLKTPLTMQQIDIDKKVSKIKKELASINAYVYFLGPDIPLNKMLNTKKEIYEWVENVDYSNNDNINIALCVLQSCKGILCNLLLAPDLVRSYVPDFRGYPFTVPLNLKGLEITTACYRFVQCESIMKPRKVPLGNPRADRTYVHADDHSIKVDRDDIIHGLALHNKLVIIPRDVNKGIQEYARCFKLLGFTDSENVPVDYMLASSTNLVNVYQTKDPKLGALNYIVEACHKFSKYGIALRAYMKNCRPKLYCLIPKVDPPHFIAVELPYAQSVNIPYKSGDCKTKKFEPDSYKDFVNVDELKDNVYSYLDSINMEDRVKLNPSLRVHPIKRRMYENLVRKVNGGEFTRLPLPLGDLKKEEFDEDQYQDIMALWSTPVPQ